MAKRRQLRGFDLKHIEGVALRGGHRRFEILDQTRLPDAEIWLDASDPEAMVGHIQRLSVRGAPLIGVAAALSVAAVAAAQRRIR